MMTFFKNFALLLAKHWFLVGLILSIALAAAYPPLGRENGIIHSEITISYIGVGLIFLISGFSLHSKVLGKALSYGRLIVLVQGISFGFIPTAGYALSKLLYTLDFDPTLANGIVVCCAIPTTISSNVLMTKQAGGNEAASLTNAVLGSVLGVFVSPALIFWLLNLGSASNPVNYASVFTKLSITVIGPLILGQILRYLVPDAIAWLQKYINFAYVNSSLLLLLVYQVFCDTFSSDAFQTVSPTSFVIVMFLVLALFLLFSLFCFSVSRIPWFGFSKKDSIAIVMCGATKSAQRVMFQGNPAIGIITIPLLIYHAEQLVAGSVMIPFLHQWVKDEANKPCTFSLNLLIVQMVMF